MCDCSKVHLYEVEFNWKGMIVVPTHKNCGESLNDNNRQIPKRAIKSWGFEDEDEEEE